MTSTTLQSHVAGTYLALADLLEARPPPGRSHRSAQAGACARHRPRDDAGSLRRGHVHGRTPAGRLPVRPALEPDRRTRRRPPDPRTWSRTSDPRRCTTGARRVATSTGHSITSSSTSSTSPCRWENRDVRVTTPSGSCSTTSPAVACTTISEPGSPVAPSRHRHRLVVRGRRIGDRYGRRHRVSPAWPDHGEGFARRLTTSRLSARTPGGPSSCGAGWR